MLRVAVIAAALSGLAIAGYRGWLSVRQLMSSGLASPAAPSAVLYLIFAVAGLVLGLTALGIARRAWDSQGNQLLGLFLGLLAPVAADDRLLGLFALLPPSPSLITTVVREFLIGGLMALVLATMIRWSQCFPERLTPHAVRRLWKPTPRWLTYVAGPAASVQVMLLNGWATWGVFGVGGFALLSLEGLGVPLDALFARAIGFPAVAISIANLTATYRWATDPRSRSQTHWVLEAVLLLALALLLSIAPEYAIHVRGTANPIVNWLHAIVLPSGVLLFAASLSFSVFYRGAVSPQLVVNKTALYGSVSLVLTLVFVAVEEIVSGLVVAWLSLPDQVGGVVAGVAAALLFGPTQAWFRKRVPTPSATPVNKQDSSEQAKPAL